VHLNWNMSPISNAKQSVSFNSQPPSSPPRQGSYCFLKQRGQRWQDRHLPQQWLRLSDTTGQGRFTAHMFKTHLLLLSALLAWLLVSMDDCGAVFKTKNKRTLNKRQWFFHHHLNVSLCLTNRLNHASQQISKKAQHQQNEQMWDMQRIFEITGHLLVEVMKELTKGAWMYNLYIDLMHQRNKGAAILSVFCGRSVHLYAL